MRRGRSAATSRKERFMAAYFIAQYVVKDPALYGEYQQGAGPTIAKYGGELVAFDLAADVLSSMSA